MNFFIHSLNRFVFEKLFTGCRFSSVLCSFLSLYMQIYLLNARKLNWEEKLVGFYAESIAFTIKIFMRITLIINDSSVCLKVTCIGRYLDQIGNHVVKMCGQKFNLHVPFITLLNIFVHVWMCAHAIAHLSWKGLIIYGKQELEVSEFINPFVGLCSL